MNAHAAAATPVLRTVLLCDIVESTALVERLGDMRAVALLRQHDTLLREAMAFCHGQLIDKADGVLAVFERPIQALDFALRYQRGLRELGNREKLDLKARVGIHVGDVMMWPNEPKDVLAGAKAFELEGLAKPVAARLMNLALPGQILMSGMAQNLSQRAVGELGDAGKPLRWLMHGRYSFKGVPAPMLVHEVGEPGLAPLRPPASGAKAWREVPLWRRPPVLALELLLVGVLGAAVFWSTLRSEPALAFAERDWVVVADLQNRTDEPVFDDALDVALRIGLEQSRHVNLVSQLQIDRALERMQRAGQPIDRQVATELALREGARAVIVPTLAEVGGVVRVSLELVDPASGVTVYSESADARGISEVLPALDEAIAEVRGRLGEELGAVNASRQPLDEVTTGDIEALRLFSLGTRARLQRRDDDALALFTEAIERDPDFSMAYLRRGAILLAGDPDGAKRDFEMAAARRDRLTQREGMLVDASLALLGPPKAAIDRWKVFAALYPDEYRAHYNYSYFAHFLLQDYATALQAIEPALSAYNPSSPHAYYMKGTVLLASNRTGEAIKAFEQAEVAGVGGYKREQADAYIALRDYPRARAVIDRQKSSGFPGDLMHERVATVSHPLDRGRWPAAQQALDVLAGKVGSAGHAAVQGQRLMVLQLSAYAPDDTLAGELEAFMTAESTAAGADNPLALPHRQFRLLAAGWIAAQAGLPALAARAHSLAEPISGDYTAVSDMALVLAAEQALQSGDAAAAVRSLSPRVGSGNELYLLHAVLMRALVEAGQLEPALEEAEWLATHRGRAFGEPNSNYVLQPTNVIESNLALLAAAELSARLGRKKAAQAHRAEFTRAWPDGGELPAISRRREALD